MATRKEREVSSEITTDETLFIGFRGVEGVERGPKRTISKTLTKDPFGELVIVVQNAHKVGELGVVEVAQGRRDQKDIGVVVAITIVLVVFCVAEESFIKVVFVLVAVTVDVEGLADDAKHVTVGVDAGARGGGDAEDFVEEDEDGEDGEKERETWVVVVDAVQLGPIDQREEAGAAEGLEDPERTWEGGDDSEGFIVEKDSTKGREGEKVEHRHRTHPSEVDGREKADLERQESR